MCLQHTKKKHKSFQGFQTVVMLAYMASVLWYWITYLLDKLKTFQGFQTVAMLAYMASLLWYWVTYLLDNLNISLF